MKCYNYGLCLLALITTWPLANAERWESAKISTVLDNQNFMLSDRSRLSIIGITIPDLFFPEPQSKCFNTHLHKTLKALLENQKVKIKIPNSSKNTSDEIQAHVKFEKTKNLASFLLHQGWAQTNEDSHQYQKDYAKLQKIAQKEKKGLWGSCHPYKEVQQKMFDQGRIWFNPQYNSFLAPVSTGWVASVKDGQTLVLTNGLKVKLLGLSVPDLEDPRPHYRCFATQAKRYLERLLQGQKVILSKDETQVTNFNTLGRYVFFPGTKSRKKIFVNQHLIAQGYAKSMTTYPDLKYKKILENTQQSLFKEPKGAWRQCLKVHKK